MLRTNPPGGPPGPECLSKSSKTGLKPHKNKPNCRVQEWAGNTFCYLAGGLICHPNDSSQEKKSNLLYFAYKWPEAIALLYGADPFFKRAPQPFSAYGWAVIQYYQDRTYNGAYTPALLNLPSKPASLSDPVHGVCKNADASLEPNFQEYVTNIRKSGDFAGSLTTVMSIFI